MANNETYDPKRNAGQRKPEGNRPEDEEEIVPGSGNRQMYK